MDNNMDNQNPLNFPYRTLDDKEAVVRLVRIYREGDGSITGKLEEFCLDSPDCPSYMTLSYVWGRKVYPKDINLNVQRFSILEILYPALELICDTPSLSSSWWWIDSICINQSEDRQAQIERGSQVRLMGRIYKASESTICWLGNASEDNTPGQTAHEAIDFLHILVENSSRLQSSHDSEQRAAVRQLSDRTKWAAVERLLLRPWWRRVWTLQEYIIAQHFVFYCGTKSISRDHFRIASLAIYWCRRFDDTLITMQAVQSAWNRRRIYHWYKYGYQMSLIGLIALGSDSRATDSRDRIYALLELIKDQGLVPKPDYNAKIAAFI